MLVFLALVTPPGVRNAWSDGNPNKEQGYAPTQVFKGYGSEDVKVLNRNLVVRHPVGPEYKVGGNLSYRLSCTYNSARVRVESIGDSGA